MTSHHTPPHPGRATFGEAQRNSPLSQRAGFASSQKDGTKLCRLLAPHMFISRKRTPLLEASPGYPSCIPLFVRDKGKHEWSVIPLRLAPQYLPEIRANTNDMLPLDNPPPFSHQTHPQRVYPDTSVNQCLANLSTLRIAR